MQVRSFLLTTGLSMAAGAAVVLMLPSHSTVRQAADRAAQNIECAVKKSASAMLH